MKSIISKSRRHPDGQPRRERLLERTLQRPQQREVKMALVPLVEDNTNLRALETLVKDIGYRVCVAHGGEVLRRR